ncbi:hypothetical protein CEPID_04900 [Corynebacterium epidermidicanis]|uniref:Uncharacterized protein n=1 Tax=Corynebacterium epidermidicanis TaxID=1050174 RepID=A0A0G3GQL5_9CORY|nr:hypothetical protein CEPID_04900 [Corynebacterium epidermidicanis]
MPLSESIWLSVFVGDDIPLADVHLVLTQAPKLCFAKLVFSGLVEVVTTMEPSEILTSFRIGRKFTSGKILR